MIKHTPLHIKTFFLSNEVEESWSKRLPDISLVYLLFSVSYFYWYLIEPSVPANDLNSYIGWWGWWDQGQYHKTAGELAAGHLGQSQYWWGYPMIGALLYKVMPAHSFFFPNYLLSFAIVLFFYFMAVRFVTRIEALVLMILLILGSRNMMFESLIIPWNTIVTYAAVFSISYLLVIRGASRRAVYFCIALVGLSALVRPSDTLFLLIYVIFIFYFRFDFKTFVKMSGLAVIIVLISAAILCLLNFKAFGQIIPPYVDAAKSVGMSLNGIGFRLYQLYVDGTLIHGNSALPPGRITPALLVKLPLMVFSLAGSWLVWRRIGNIALPMIGVCFGAIIFYAAFNAAGNPPHFWSFLLFHYFWWSGVILSLFGYIFLHDWILRRNIPRTAKGIAAFSVMSLALVGFGEEVTTYSMPAGHSQASSFKMLQVGENTQLTLKFQGNDDKGLRLTFRNTLPFHLTAPGQENIVSVEINGEKWHYWKDFIVSQEGSDVNFHFYRSPPEINTTAIIILKGLTNSDLISARWIRVKFHPFATVYRLTNWLFGPQFALGLSPYLTESYYIGNTIKFGNVEAHNHKYLLSGWSTPEAEHVWSVKKTAKLLLEINSQKLDSKSCVMDIDFVTFNANTLAVTMNGKPVGRPVPSSGLRQIVQLPCPDILGSSLIIGFEVDHLLSPASIGMNDDLRKLGLALFSVRIAREVDQ